MNTISDILNDFKIYPVIWKNNKYTLCLNLSKDIDYEKTSDPIYIDTVNKRCIEIFKEIFEDKDEIMFIANTYSDDFVYDFVKIKSYIRNKNVLKTLNLISENMEIENEVIEIKHYCLKCKVNDLNYNKLIRHLTEQDLGKNYKGLADYYIVKLNEKIVFRYCLDEYIDIVFDNVDNMNQYKSRFLNYYEEQ
ncbi:MULTISPECIES: hypothetical protein [Clostridium]|uniref:DUF3885 domain-containing protein n=1 Tax=Clostridium TaxID=1485 RepID=UPI0012E65A08|nr:MULTISPECIES: hypothetical protein [Clostridium]MBS4783996.1 hypothetical protein [Clostridium sp.]CAG9709219.1 Conserved hypothetical protein [Clostridium neonatale]CAG9713880.1 Conserved hypothetical protein [Clostridium neonatale]CAI3645499.1 Conserved hypothetical protein [Clostridium neonatale]CAI3653226.1 Conserved hypothetical protein [Clostridium neonatale]